MTIYTPFRAFLVGLFIAFALAVSAPSAAAGDPQIDAAKAAGIVGERIDGYLGFVTVSSDASLQRKVNEINAKRRALYQSLSRETGTTVEQVGIVTGEKQIANAQSGEYYMNAQGQWVRK